MNASPSHTDSRTGMRRRVSDLLFPRAGAPARSVKSLLRFAAKSMVGVGGVFFVILSGLRRKRHRVVLDEFLGQLGLTPVRPPAELPTIAVDELPGAGVPVTIHEPIHQDGNVSLLELLLLARLVASRQPGVVFEIGTFDGRTTLNFAANTPGKVFTLDLPAEKFDSTRHALDPGDTRYIVKPVSGSRFLQRPEAARITQLYGDSGSFDFSLWAGKVDFVFIDGAHSYDYVLSDTARAQTLLRPEGGIIVWHDYDASFEGVTRALNELLKRGVPVKHVAGTSLALLITRSQADN